MEGNELSTNEIPSPQLKYFLRHQKGTRESAYPEQRRRIHGRGVAVEP